MTEAATAAPTAFQKHFLNFDIDNYLNPICPRPRWYLLPNFVSFWFGYRAPGVRPQPKLPNPALWVSAFIGGFCGIAIITNVYKHLPLLSGHQAPVVIASFGAAAILEYNSIESPLSQPRNLIVGHLLSALIGVGVTKAFEHLPFERFEDLRWLAGSISVGLASLVMSVTKTVHPPAGATALLASTTPEITVLGWWLLPLVLLASALMCASALVINNLTRRWPLYWWTAADLSPKKPDIEHLKDIEKPVDASLDSDRSFSDGSEPETLAKVYSRYVENVDAHSRPGLPLERRASSVSMRYKRRASSVSRDGGRPSSQSRSGDLRESTILITADEIVIPDWMEADDWEKEVLLIFKERLHDRRQSFSPRNNKNWP